MARTARGDYVAIDKEAVYYIRCRTNRTLVLQSHPELISELDDAQIARRWLSICPTLRRGDDLSDELSDEEIQALCDDPPGFLRSVGSSVISHG
ncbi:MAG UNVERIFIED_CONTAM: hypothetical protein LVR18_30975 [Planctomycetaceae bacterium]|jgi:hypothetical protein